MTVTVEPPAPAPTDRKDRRKRRRQPNLGWLRTGRRRAAARLRAMWRWMRRGPRDTPMPAVYRSRRLAAPRQTVVWTGVAGAVLLGLLSAYSASRKARPPAPVEVDRGAAAASWAAAAWRDSAALGQTPMPVAVVNEGGGYWRVTLDRGNQAGCVQLGVIDRPGGYRLAGEHPAPVPCPPVQAAPAYVGDDAVGELRGYVQRFLADYLAGQPLDVWAAPGVTLTPPASASTYKIEAIKARTADNREHGQVQDVTVTLTADQGAGDTRLAVRVLVKYRSGKPEVVDVKGGAFVEDVTPRTLPIPTVTTTTAAATTTTTTVRPPVTTAPDATTTPSTSPAPPAGAGA